MGRKAWLFCWGVDPYTYLVDVLQRVADHPQSEVGGLARRIWKQKFADWEVPSPALASSISG
ncbi:MAG: transposase domain-containing protein [Phycisphaerales bacterium JB058]